MPNDLLEIAGVVLIAIFAWLVWAPLPLAVLGVYCVARAAVNERAGR